MLQQNFRIKLAAIALFIAFYGVFYTLALLAPAAGLEYDDLAAPQWVKLIPFGCTLAWLYLTRRLLQTLGASDPVAWTICAITAASPTVLYLATHRTREPLLALLLAAALLALLNTRPVVAGILAALACAVQTAGIAFVAAGIITLVARRRLRDAMLFAIASMALTAPAIGWKLAHGGGVTNILTHLHASEKAAVIGANLISLIEAPAMFISGSLSIYGATMFGPVLLWAVFKRRHLLPDVLVLLFGFVLLLRIWPPERTFAAVFPLLLWMLWRGFRTLRTEIMVAAVILLIGMEMVTTIRRFPALLRSQDFPSGSVAVADWPAIETLAGYIRSSTPRESVVIANLHQTFALETGHRVIPGFPRDAFRVAYQAAVPVIAPDVLAERMRHSGAQYLALTPDRGRPEAASFRRAAEALERGGVLAAVNVPNLPPGYRLLSYVPIF